MVVVVFPRTVQPVPPALGRCAPEPEYEAEIVRAPTAMPDTLTEQLETPATPATSAQDAGETESAAVEDTETDPAGFDLAPCASVSVTVIVTVAA